MRERDRKITVDFREAEVAQEGEPKLLMLTFARCHVNIYPSSIETVFDDGTRVVTRPEFSKEQRRRAATLGYGDDVGALCREHEILHTWLAEAHGLTYSPALWTRAHHSRDWEDGTADWVMEEENKYVFLFQAYLNGQAAAARDLPLQASLWRDQCLELLRGTRG